MSNYTSLSIYNNITIHNVTMGECAGVVFNNWKDDDIIDLYFSEPRLNIEKEDISEFVALLNQLGYFVEYLGIKSITEINDEHRKIMKLPGYIIPILTYYTNNSYRSYILPHKDEVLTFRIKVKDFPNSNSTRERNILLLSTVQLIRLLYSSRYKGIANKFMEYSKTLPYDLFESLQLAFHPFNDEYLSNYSLLAKPTDEGILSKIITKEQFAEKLKTSATMFTAYSYPIVLTSDIIDEYNSVVNDVEKLYEFLTKEYELYSVEDWRISDKLTLKRYNMEGIYSNYGNLNNKFLTIKKNE